MIPSRDAQLTDSYKLSNGVTLSVWKGTYKEGKWTNYEYREAVWVIASLNGKELTRKRYSGKNLELAELDILDTVSRFGNEA